MVAVADVYDSLSTKQVYKEAWLEKEVQHEMRKVHLVSSYWKTRPIKNTCSPLLLDSADKKLSVPLCYPIGHDRIFRVNDHHLA